MFNLFINVLLPMTFILFTSKMGYLNEYEIKHRKWLLQ